MKQAAPPPLSPREGAAVSAWPSRGSRVARGSAETRHGDTSSTPQAGQRAARRLRQKTVCTAVCWTLFSEPLDMNKEAWRCRAQALCTFLQSVRERSFPAPDGRFGRRQTSLVYSLRGEARERRETWGNCCVCGVRRVAPPAESLLRELGALMKKHPTGA